MFVLFILCTEYSRTGSLPLTASTREPKIIVFRAVVLFSRLYACETWALYRQVIKHLEQYRQTKHRRILRICWEDRITTKDVISWAFLLPSRLPSFKTASAGQATCLQCIRLDSNVLSCLESLSTAGGPKRHCMDHLKTSLTQSQIEDLRRTVTGSPHVQLHPPPTIVCDYYSRLE